MLNLNDQLVAIEWADGQKTKSSSHEKQTALNSASEREELSRAKCFCTQRSSGSAATSDFRVNLNMYLVPMLKFE